MVKSLFSLGLILCLVSCGSNSKQPDVVFVAADSLNLIPYPQAIEKGEGYFKMNEEVNFFFSDEISSEGLDLINSFIDSKTNSIKPNIESKSNANTCHLILSNDFESLNNSPEAYEINVTNKDLTLTAKTINGLRYGIQTLKQMRAQTKSATESAYLLPAMKITDFPRFQHRGLLLDVCRHYFDIEVLLKYLESMEYFKMNVLHLHLTEDQGWRMPIDAYPLLNQISSWRLDTNGNQYGGFYSKDDLKYLVEFATDRNITIIPEIELPGHSQAALAAYPQFSCNGGPIEVVNDWGVFKEIYCAGNDSTFVFIENILTEVMEIFPSEYIHIGGDEAPKFRWEHCDKCQKRMLDEGLKDEHELQAYFIQRIESFLNENGRKLIGWDEILEGGLSPTAAVQSWRGMDGGKQAAETKHEVVMSPTSHCYLDYSLNSIDLEKIYSFDPIPVDLAEEYHQYIIGGECNMWTEHVPNEANLDSKVFPRMIGLAEALWSYPEERNFEDFYKRLQYHYPVLTDFGIDYGLETIGATITQEFRDSGVFIILNKNLSDLELKHSKRGGRHAEMLWEYEGPFPMLTQDLRVQAYKNDEPYGEEITQGFNVHQGVNKKVTYTTPWSDWYAGNGEKNLVDGKLGSIDFRDGNWQGFWGEDIDVTIDLGESQHFLGVSANFYQYANSWIFSPKRVTFQISTNGEEWKDKSVRTFNSIDLSNKKSIQKVSFGSDLMQGFYGRYIRLTVESIGKVPDGHEAAGQDSWLFIDEIIIQ
ncbi:MAG: family 20 glycosylhydrolase [Crocinitomix sp.]|nr:family 20 glycosylhydrolase [Crocinitomix sp.]